MSSTTCDGQSMRNVDARNAPAVNRADRKGPPLPAVLASSSRTRSVQPRTVCAPPWALIVASALALALFACGGGREAGGGLGPQEGAGHPMAGRKAPDFAAQDPAGLWLPLANL